MLSAHGCSNMAKFLNTTSLNFFLEQLIQKSTRHLVLISPYLKINHRLRELIEEKVTAGIPVTIVYGKTDISQSEKDWFICQPKIEVHFCKDLHAKCYMNEGNAIICSLNLYEFSQINNKEMGVLLTKNKDTEAFGDAAEEVQRLVRTSLTVSFTSDPEPADAIDLTEDLDKQEAESDADSSTAQLSLLTTSKLAQKNSTTAAKLQESLITLGYLELKDEKPYLTEKGKTSGGQFRKGQFGVYFLWPEDIDLVEKKKTGWKRFKKK